MDFLEWIGNIVVAIIGFIPLLLMVMLLMSTAVYTLGYIYDIIFGNWIIQLGHKIGKKYYKIKNVSIIRKIWSLMQPKECYLRYATPVISYCFSYMAVSLLKLFIPTRNANISYIEAALVYIILYFVGLKRKYGKNDKKRLNHKFCGISDSSRSSVGSYRIASERNIRHQDIRIPVCEES